MLLQPYVQARMIGDGVEEVSLRPRNIEFIYDGTMNIYNRETDRCFISITKEDKFERSKGSN